MIPNREAKINGFCDFGPSPDLLLDGIPNSCGFRLPLHLMEISQGNPQPREIRGLVAVLIL